LLARHSQLLLGSHSSYNINSKFYNAIKLWAANIHNQLGISKWLQKLFQIPKMPLKVDRAFSQLIVYICQHNQMIMLVFFVVHITHKNLSVLIYVQRITIHILVGWDFSCGIQTIKYHHDDDAFIRTKITRVVLEVPTPI